MCFMYVTLYYISINICLRYLYGAARICLYPYIPMTSFLLDSVLPHLRSPLNLKTYVHLIFTNIMLGNYVTNYRVFGFLV